LSNQVRVSAVPCEKHDTSGCVDCLPRQARTRADESRFGPEFPAGYPGTCSLDKSHRIEPGDQIRADGDGGYACHREHL
jgi:hypothetical protein